MVKTPDFLMGSGEIQRVSRASLPEDWVPMDGDTLVTVEGFVFSVFGYEHPEGRAIAFLKYIPSRLRGLFKVRILDRTWRFEGDELLRAERLYTAGNYRAILASFRENLSDYVYYCPHRMKEVLAVPLDRVRRVYSPRESLRALLEVGAKDPVQRCALDLIELLSESSRVPLEDLGLHGSIAMNMHSAGSDVDVVVYGGQNFRRVEESVGRLVGEGVLTYTFKNRLDRVRRYRGSFQGRAFNINATRKLEEVRSRYGDHRYIPILPLRLLCRVRGDEEAAFRPAIYRIGGVRPFKNGPAPPGGITPEAAVSMIGCYRNVARVGWEVEVLGMLERVEDTRTGRVSYQVVVGTAEREEEYIWPLKPSGIGTP